MSQKVRKTLIMIVMAALIICLMAASLTYTFTYGRYAGGKFDEEKSPYDDLIEFVGAREYTVRSPEELIQAIKDGYSNIVIAEDAEEPFVITEGVTDVEANLVLNLNGKVVVRNSRNPMLDVQTNVSVVLVYDSKQTGAFYNPVGSSLMASGGSLTVGSGGYESGPRAEEYQGKEAAGELSPLSSDVDVAIFTRGGITSPNAVDRANPNQLFYQQIEVSSYPVPKTTGRYYRETAGSGYDFVPADTFLVYTVEENCFIGDDTSSGDVEFESGKLYVDAESEKVGNDTIITASEFTTPLCNVASCDFYYYYPISGTAGTAESPQDYAVIYGYWDVMKLARDDGGAATALKDSGLIHPYGAVRMVEGEGIVRGGTFSNHFDAVNTYGIYAEGGTLAVSQVPVTSGSITTNFTTGGDGVCIRVQSAEAEDKTTGGSLTISGGEFSSEIGNTIEMSGGKMTVTAGTFTKSAARSDGNDQIANQTAIIDIQGGTLTIKGNSADSVKLTAGSAVTNPDDGTVTYSGTLQNVFGIRAEGGTVTTSGCTFNISGDYSAGVLSYNGTINLDDNTVIYVTQSNEFTDTNNNILLTSAGVSSEQASEDGEYPVNILGDVTITSNGLGITARGAVNVTEGESTVTTYRGTGIYVNNGSFTVGSEAAITVNSTVQSGYSWANPPGNTATNTPNIYNGVYVQGGSLESEGTLNVNFTGVAADQGETTSFPTEEKPKSYAVYVDKGAGNSASATVAGGTINAGQAGGVYVEGGSVALGGSSTVTINTGAWTDTGETQTISSLQGTYASAVYAHGGTVTMNGTITINSAALGIVAVGTDGSTTAGTVTIESGTTTVTAKRSTGVYIRGGTLKNDGTLDVTSTIKNPAGENVAYDNKDTNTFYPDGNSAYKWAGADIDDDTDNANIYNGIFVNGGSLTSNGTLDVTFTGVENDQNQTVNEAALTGTNAYRLFEIKSYAVRVEAEEGVNTTVTIASGNITNSVGGGVLVNGGTVTLGTTGEGAYNESTKRGLTVQTTGHESFTNEMNAGPGGNWIYKLPKTGGPAIKVTQSGSNLSTLTVYGGTYTAQQGDGIVTVGGTSYIHNGTFIGRDFGVASGGRAGPGASYSFKVYGGTANVYGGTFGGRENGSYINSSGAFVMGTANSMGSANIYGGSFVVSKVLSNNEDNGGQAGFSVYEYGNVVVDPGKGGEQQNLGGEVTMTGLAAGLVIEGNTSNPASVQISGGSFSSTRNHGNSDGIWYSNSNATLTISGGTFTGANRSGLCLAAAPGFANAVTISGGKITGYQDGILYSKSVAIDGDGYGLTISGGTITGTGTTNVHAHALKIDTEPQRHSILIEDGATLNGGRDAIFVSQFGGDSEAVSITGGSIQGGTVSSGGCAIWFSNNIDSGVFVISGGTLTSNGGGAIATPNPRVYYLRRILRDDCLLIDKDNNQYDGNNSFYDIEDESEITVRRS